MSRQGEKDIYYMRLARQVADRSKCLSKRVGAIIVRDDSIISTGYNGPPRGVYHMDQRTPTNLYAVGVITSQEYIHLSGKEVSLISECPRVSLNYGSGVKPEICPCAHAEQNAIAQAARNGVSTDGATLYLYFPLGGVPCQWCTYNIIGAGIIRIVTFGGDSDWKVRRGWSATMLSESGITVDFYEEDEIWTKD